MTTNDNDDIAKVLDVLSRKLFACTDEDRDYIQKKLVKGWKSKNKGWPIGMLECFAEKIMYDFHWTDTMVHYNHNSEKPLDENNLKEKCPRCINGTLVTDHESGEIFCSQCGFEINNISGKNVPIDNISDENKKEWA